MTLQPDTEPATSRAVTLTGINKKYGAFHALRGLDVGFEPGMIHALVGQNGAGKSTCLGLIAGRITPTTGKIQILDREFTSGLDTRSAATAGVAAVYQELSLFTEMTAIENVFIGRLGHAASLANLKRFEPEYLELCHALGVHIAPRSIVRTLSVAKQQMLEIMRGLALESQVLLLDEPTAVLAPAERESLFATMRDLRDRGVTIIFVSHYLDEVLAVSDTVTVFRNGALIEKAPVARWSEPSLVQHMLGEEAAQLEQAELARAVSPHEHPAPLLEITGLSVGKLTTINFKVNRGEIVGIGGLVGSGRSTLLRALAGAQPANRGVMQLDGRTVQPPQSPRDAWRLGIGYIPEERKTDGLALERSSTDNVIMSDYRQVSRLGWIHPPTVDRLVGRLADRFSIAQRLLRLPAGQLSGGNQQKVLFARWGLRAPKLLLADESTRGVDIGAKGQIMQMLREMANNGMGVVFVSSDLEEVAAVSDRIYVFKSGSIVGEIQSTAETTQEDILSLAFGVGQQHVD